MRHNRKKRSAKAASASKKKIHKSAEKQKKPEITMASYSVIGDRLTQEDAVYLSAEGAVSLTQKKRVLAVICDGMGGMANGGQASATAIQMIKDTFEQIQEDPEVNIPNFFISGIKTIDKTINDFPKENGRGSGTTMVAVLVENSQLYWASVGDSRIYILREETLTQVTRDHNYMLRLQGMVDQGQITQEEANANRQREALISFLGIGNVSLLDVNMDPFVLQSGDIILLTSDGMTKVLSEEQIKDILSDNSSVEDRAKKLVETAVEQNMRSQDNTTVAVLQYQETI
ncbi:MAG: protein phosphatase 2C domain-containing protein [Lachnospiraceae bacterium]|nr:protein phosphatase 2C domain-containing protein [Lachnospiraceae bacterium]